MSNSKTAIILSALFFSEAIAKEGADLQSLFGQAVDYMKNLENQAADLADIKSKYTELEGLLSDADADEEAKLAIITNLSGQLETANKSLATLKDQLTKSDELLAAANNELAGNDLADQIAELKQQLQVAEADRDDALKEVASLSEKLDLQEKVKDLPGILVTVNGENLMLIGKRFLTKDAKGQPVELTAEEAAKDQEWLNRMYASGSGLLVPADQLTEGITE